ncbi:hypothetical protein DPMN_028936 [Dreissena polymorpha]|uniref:Uncharacterized protein n=1 Tax=Dreissena polymorpha TaxID=45954 RepID=A0A9D4RGL7_DREPO|nr:hypothetical protein DPMN_028936 [Dreissena polymorpha]
MFPKNFPTHPGGHENTSYIHIEKIAPSPGSHVFPLITTIFKVIRHINKTNAQNIIGTNLLTKFHEDPLEAMKNAPPLDSHVFQAKVTIFKLNQDIIGTNLLTKFHEDLKINVASSVLTRKKALPPGGHVFQAKLTIFELNRHIQKRHVLTKFHEDWTKNVTSRFHVDWEKLNTAPPPGGHVFQRTGTIFELNQHII